MLMRLLITVVALWLLFTFTETILVWGAYAIAFLRDHVHVTIS